jgi:fumarate reductase (CoM/CoB) subunit A
MELKSHERIDVDVLVLGGGGAGLRAAIEARKHGVSVLLISKSRVGLGNNTAISGSGIAAGTGWRVPTDSTEVHLKDTIIAGRYMSNQHLAEVMARESGQQVLDLENFGVRFRKRGKDFHMALMAGHTYPRNVFGDNAVGTDLTRPLRDHAAGVGVEHKEGVLITKLLTAGDAVVGAMGFDEAGGVSIFNAKSTILATGGAGHVHLSTSNAVGSTGDGFVLAYDVGVPLVDMEFVQFTLSGPNAEMFCAREGAIVQNSKGENILEKYDIGDPVKMTRDALSRAIMMEILEGNSDDGLTLILDTTPISDDRFERLRVLLPKNTPRNKRYFNVGLQSHFFMGGAKIDENTETCIEGLYAAGEVCGGIHGASRLGGNGLAEAFVFGRIAGDRAAQRARNVEKHSLDSSQITDEVERLEKLATSGGEDIKELERSMKTTMWNRSGIVRNEKELTKALEEILSLKERFHQISLEGHRALADAIKLGNMLEVSEMLVRAALFRTESRGAHYRSDYPEENDSEWLKNVVITRHDDRMRLTTTPVEMVKFSP